MHNAILFFYSVRVNVIQISITKCFTNKKTVIGTTSKYYIWNTIMLRCVSVHAWILLLGPPNIVPEHKLSLLNMHRNETHNLIESSIFILWYVKLRGYTFSVKWKRIRNLQLKFSCVIESYFDQYTIYLKINIFCYESIYNFLAVRSINEYINVMRLSWLSIFLNRIGTYISSFVKLATIEASHRTPNDRKVRSNLRCRRTFVSCCPFY